jgi:NADH dehydrogenase
MFLPFYFPSSQSIRVAILGGGYSGLAALITLREHCSNAEIILVDPRSEHLKITHLHESFRRRWSDCWVPFSALERRFGFRHIQATVELDEQQVKLWQNQRSLTVDTRETTEEVEFDYLLIAVGAGSRKTEQNSAVCDLDDFIATSGP